MLYAIFLFPAIISAIFARNLKLIPFLLMQIDKNKFVSLIYELREASPEGKVIEALDDTRPLTFICGSGRLLPGFEANLLSLSKGDNFSFLLNSATAYGDMREDLIINIPISVFQTDGNIDENICRIGNEVPMMDREGNRISGIINEITDTYVRMDFNHPMAGRDLHFSGRILDVHEASAEELNSFNNPCSSCGGSTDSTGCDGNCG